MNAGLLFGTWMLVWGTTWFAIESQIDAVAPAVGAALRCSLAALILLGRCELRGIGLRLCAREHTWLIGLGALGFSLSYLLVIATSASSSPVWWRSATRRRRL